MDRVHLSQEGLLGPEPLSTPNHSIEEHVAVAEAATGVVIPNHAVGEGGAHDAGGVTVYEMLTWTDDRCRHDAELEGSMTANTDLVARIRERGLPEVVARIATEGGEAVSPALFYRAEAVWPETAEAVTSGRAEDLVPLWSCNTTHAFAGQGRFLLWSAESDEPYEVFGTFAELVQDLLTDLYEDDEDDEERSRIAHLLLPPDEAVGALVPLER